MPYANLPEDKWGEMDRCVEDVMSKQGLEKERAIAICFPSVSGKSEKNAMQELSEKHPGHDDQSVHNPQGGGGKGDSKRGRDIAKRATRKIDFGDKKRYRVSEASHNNWDMYDKSHNEYVLSGLTADESADIQSAFKGFYVDFVDSIFARFKAGARHSTGDQKNLQTIHDASVDLGASCPMTVFKQADGSYRWVLFSSTAYKDRDGEIVSTKAQEDDCNLMDETGDYGVLRWWHMGSPYAKTKGDWRSWVAGKGVDLGACDFSAMHGRVRIESGTFYNDEIGARFKELADQISVSIGFAHPDDEPNTGGVFEHTHTFERSLLPVGMQSNHFVSVPLIEKESQMEDKKENKLKELLGGMAELVLGKAEATDKAAEGSGVAFKAIGEWDEAQLKAFVRKCMDETMKAHMPEPDADDKAKAAKEAQVKETQTTKALDAIQTSLKELQSNDEKIATALGALGKMQTANAEAIKSLQGDLPRSLASLKRSTALDNIISEEVVTQNVPSLKQDGGFGDFMNFAVTGSANGGKPPAG